MKHISVFLYILYKKVFKSNFRILLYNNYLILQIYKPSNNIKRQMQEDKEKDNKHQQFDNRQQKNYHQKTFNHNKRDKNHYKFDSKYERWNKQLYNQSNCLDFISKQVPLGIQLQQLYINTKGTLMNFSFQEQVMMRVISENVLSDGFNDYNYIYQPFEKNSGIQKPKINIFIQIKKWDFMIKQSSIILHQYKALCKTKTNPPQSQHFSFFYINEVEQGQKTFYKASLKKKIVQYNKQNRTDENLQEQTIEKNLFVILQKPASTQNLLPENINGYIEIEDVKQQFYNKIFGKRQIQIESSFVCVKKRVYQNEEKQNSNVNT